MSEGTIAALRLDDEDPVLEAKVYRKWISKNISDTKEEAFCCILIDKQGNAVQATMDPHDARLFDSKLKKNTVYRITDFICENADPYMQTLPTKISLAFGRVTSFVELPGKETEFPDHYFQFTSYNELESKIPYRDKDTNKMVYSTLTDFLGCLRSFSDLVPPKPTDKKPRYRRNLTIESTEGNMVGVTLWGDVALQFKKEEVEKIRFPQITAVTSCTVSQYRGAYQLGSTAATHFYINIKIPEIQAAFTMFKQKYSLNPPLEVKRYPSVNPEEERNRNRSTLKTLIAQDPANFQNVRFTCKARITNFVGTSWNYASCTKCNNSSTRVNTIYKCKNHGKQIPTPYRYNFKATITDGTTTAEFIFFTEAGEKLTHTPCTDLRKRHLESGQMQLPTEMTASIGKTQIFQIQFTSGSQKGSTRFTVKDIFDLPPEDPQEMTGTSSSSIESYTTDNEAATQTTTTEQASNTYQEDNTYDLTGTPPPDVIETVGEPNITTIESKRKQAETSTAKTSTAKRSLLPDMSAEHKKKKEQQRQT